MITRKKMKSDLDKKLREVLETPAGFDFFVAIHGFVKHIERNSFLSGGLSDRIKINRESGIVNKYAYLKKIYQGLEDIHSNSNVDLGHERYMIIRELNQIENKQLSESNSFWKKRELSRKLIGEVHERLTAYLSEPKK